MANYNAIASDIRAAILAAYQAGEKTDVIAIEYGLNRSTPRQVAKRAGIPPRPLYSRQRKVDDAAIARPVAMAATGHP